MGFYGNNRCRNCIDIHQMPDLSILSLCELFCSVIAPSGYESNMASIISSLFDGNSYTISTDACGNLICTKPVSGAKKRIAFLAHMDSAPIIVNGIDDKNNVYWGSLSTWKARKIDGQRVTFVSGATGIAHFSEDDKNQNTISDISGDVEIGDIATLTPFFKYENEIITASFLDDRIGCALLVRIAKKLISSPAEISFVFTAQEEIGNKGAQKIAQHFDFDEVFILDTTRAISEEYNAPIYASLGKGVCLKVCDGFGLCSIKLNKRVQALAANNSIALQKEVIFRGGSDISAFSKYGYNSIFTGLSIPCVSMHSRNEQVCINDVFAAERLIIEILKNENCQFNEI